MPPQTNIPATNNCILTLPFNINHKNSITKNNISFLLSAQWLCYFNRKQKAMHMDSANKISSLHFSFASQSKGFWRENCIFSLMEALRTLTAPSRHFYANSLLHTYNILSFFIINTSIIICFPFLFLLFIALPYNHKYINIHFLSKAYFLTLS